MRGSRVSSNSVTLVLIIDHLIQTWPNSDLEPLVELNNSLSSLFNGKSVPPHLVVTGDFNLPDITWSETGGRLISNPTYGSVLNNTFLNILDDFSLEQLVLSTTRGNHTV